MEADRIATLLRDRGHSATTPRRLVWEVIAAAEGHLTADEIAHRVNRQDASVNLSSVYRTLALFADLELVRESNLGTDGAARWERAHPDDEFHLVCSSCGGVEHHAGSLVEDIRGHLAGDHGFEADRVELVVTGTCRQCGRRARKQTRRSG